VRLIVLRTIEFGFGDWGGNWGVVWESEALARREDRSASGMRRCETQKADGLLKVIVDRFHARFVLDTLLFYRVGILQDRAGTICTKEDLGQEGMGHDGCRKNPDAIKAARGVKSAVISTNVMGFSRV